MRSVDKRGWCVVAMLLGLAAVVHLALVRHQRAQTWLTAEESDYLFPRIHNRYEHIEFLRRQADPGAAPAEQLLIAATHVKRHGGGIIGRVEVVVSLDDVHDQRHVDYFGLTGDFASGWTLVWDVPGWRYYLNCP